MDYPVPRGREAFRDRQAYQGYLVRLERMVSQVRKDLLESRHQSQKSRRLAR
jgi:hypothetical protein